MAIDQIVAEELTRLITAKADLKTSIEAKGVTVPSSAKLDDYPDYVDAISVGATLQAKTNITPTESSQTITADNGYDGLSSVQINAISSSYVGSGITQRTSSDLTASGATVTAPAGYYSSAATKTISSGSATPAASISGDSATVTWSYANNTLTLSKTVDNTPQVSEGYISLGTAGNTEISLTADVPARTTLTGVNGANAFLVTASGGFYPSTTSYSIPHGSATPATSISGSSATVTAGTNTLTLTKTISNTPQVTSGYISSGTAGDTDVSLTASVNTRSSSDLTVSGATVTAPSGYYVSSASYTYPNVVLSKNSISVDSNGRVTCIIDRTEGYYSVGQSYFYENLDTQAAVTITPTTSSQTAVAAGKYTTGAVTVAAMPSGTAGTPTATKGTVSNHSVSVTPSVTNTTGYITGSTINGTAVTVSASELVSGTYTVIDDGTFDITNYASLSVPGMSLPTSAVSSTSYELMRANFLPSESTRYIEIPKGFHDVDQYYMLDPVSSTYVGSGITRRSSSDLTASNLTVTAPSGYYASNATKTLTDANLLATNIKKDVSIFGVTGTYEGSGGGSTPVTHVETISQQSSFGTNGSSIVFQNVKGEPTAFVVQATGSIATSSSAKIATLSYDGDNNHVQIISNTSNAQVGYENAGGYGQMTGDGIFTVYATGTHAFATDISYSLTYVYGNSVSEIQTASVQVGSGATSITFTGLDDEPVYFACTFKSTFNTSNGYQRVISVVNDGTNIFGLEMDSSAKYSTAHWTSSFNNGSLTITSSGTNAGGYFHQPGYYQLTYVIASDGEGGSYQRKTVTPTTSQQIITADTGYEALSQVTVNAIPNTYVQPTTTVGSTTYRASTSAQTINAGTYHSAAATIAAVTQTNLTAANIKSGTTITISNGQSNLWSVTGTYTGGGSGGSFSVATTTWNNSTNTTTSHEFTGLSGTPKFAVLRCTSQLTRSSSNTYYYIADIVWNGTDAYGNYHLRSNGSFNNVASNATTKFTVTTGTNSITFTSGGTRGGAPGAFYNGTYELTYVY